MLHADFLLTIEEINGKQASIQGSTAERTIQYTPILVHTMDVTLPKSSSGALFFYFQNIYIPISNQRMEITPETHRAATFFVESD